MNKNNVIGLFPQVIYLSTYEKDMSKEIEFIKNIEYISSSIIKNRNKRSADTHILRCKELENINTFIQNQINYFLKEIMMSTNKFFITQSWINQNIKGKYHHQHTHSNSILSGVFYFKVNKTAPILFFRPSVNQLLMDYYNENFYNSNTYALPVKSGQLVIFPSTVLHGVPNNMEEETRFSLSFNTFSTELGSEENLTHLKIN